MATRKEQLTKELADIEKKEKQVAADAAAKLQAEVNKPRTIVLSDGQYKLTFLNYEKGMPHPDCIESDLNTPGFVVRHDFSGNVYDVIKVEAVADEIARRCNVHEALVQMISDLLNDADGYISSTLAAQARTMLNDYWEG